MFAEGEFGPTTSKTANMLLRYVQDQVACVVDSRYAGKMASVILPFVELQIPIVGSVAGAMEQQPTHLVIGVAPTGGQLPEGWRDAINEAIEAGLHIVSGLHTFLADDEEFAELARRNEVSLIDLRKPPETKEIARGLWRERTIPTVLTIGPDSAVGKLTTAWEFKQRLEHQGYRVGFVATGQTGILLHGQGIVVDAVRGDFMSAAVESLIQAEAETDPDVILVEGQGSIYHEGYSGVTLAILHGTMPDALLFSHRPSKRANMYGFAFPPYRQMINDYEHLIEWYKPTHSLGIQIDTSEYEEHIARALCNEIQDISGLPTCDFIRFPRSDAIDTMIRKLHLS
ncbi:MAG TPA: DUF1611 domain-containing protein [bacterium]|nr:DUF1611 domain-containing protein [bacterium]